MPGKYIRKFRGLFLSKLSIEAITREKDVILGGCMSVRTKRSVGRRVESPKDRDLVSWLEKTLCVQGAATCLWAVSRLAWAWGPGRSSDSWKCASAHLLLSYQQSAEEAREQATDTVSHDSMCFCLSMKNVLRMSFYHGVKTDVEFFLLPSERVQEDRAGIRCLTAHVSKMLGTMSEQRLPVKALKTGDIFIYAIFLRKGKLRPSEIGKKVCKLSKSWPICLLMSEAGLVWVKKLGLTIWNVPMKKWVLEKIRLYAKDHSLTNHLGFYVF